MRLNKKGETYVMICVYIMLIATVFSVVYTYASTITVVRLQKTNTEVVFDNFVTQNSILIFNNIKMGKNATNKLNTAPFYTAIKDYCTLEEKDGMYYSIDTDGAEKYRLTKPVIGFLNKDKLELYATFTMYVPVRFAGATVTTAEIPVKITSVLTSKN